MQPEYNSRAAEIRDGWVGTALGVLCILLIFLAMQELFFSRAYVGDGRLAWKAVKVGTSISFAVSLFLVKDARNYDKFEKIRFYLFGLLFFNIFALWFVPFTNRVFPSTLKQSEAEAVIVKANKTDRIKIGKRKPAEGNSFDLSLELLSQGEFGTDKVARKNRAARERHPVLRQKNYIPAEQPVGSTITVRIYQGRWGQDFILGE